MTPATARYKSSASSRGRPAAYARSRSDWRRGRGLRRHSNSSGRARSRRTRRQEAPQLGTAPAAPSIPAERRPFARGTGTLFSCARQELGTRPDQRRKALVKAAGSEKSRAAAILARGMSVSESRRLWSARCDRVDRAQGAAVLRALRRGFRSRDADLAIQLVRHGAPAPAPRGAPQSPGSSMRSTTPAGRENGGEAEPG
jgi:hypothetical protein